MNGTSLVHLCRGDTPEETASRKQDVYHKVMEGLYLGISEPAHADALNPRMFSLKETAVAFCGEEWHQRLHPEASMGRGGLIPLREAGESVDVTQFSNITGQIIYNTIRTAWDTAPFVGNDLVEESQTPFDGEKIPWVSPILSNGARVHNGMPYQSYGMAEEWINTVALDTYGAIVEVHKLTVFYDLTGQVLKTSVGVGDALRRNKEFRILDTVLGAPGTPLFSWKGVTYNPYQTAGTYWSNDIYSNPLIDWSSLRTIEAMASKVLEPDLQGAGVNIPIEIDLDSILAMPYHQADVSRILHATQVAAYNLATAPNYRTISGSPTKAYKEYNSKILYRRAVDALGLSNTVGTGVAADASQADELYFLWDSKKKPLVYKYNWPLVVVPAPPNNPEEFRRDVVAAYKASERGNASWQDPRMIFRVRGTPT